LNQFMGSSSSIGAKRVTNVCVAFRVATEKNNRAGWVPILPLYSCILYWYEFMQF
jgi:histidine-containing phosphotransfer peotein